MENGQDTHLTLHDMIGPGAMVLSNLWFIFLNTAYKKAWANGSTILLNLVARNVGHFSINYIVMNSRAKKTRPNFAELTPKEANFLILRGVLSTVTSFFTVLSLSYLDIAESMIIFQLKPFLNIALNRLIFKDPILKSHIMAGGICFVGLFLVIQPPFLFGDGEYLLTGEKIKGVFTRVFSVCTNALADQTLKRIGKKTNTLMVIHYMGAFNSMAFGLFYGILDRPTVHTPTCYSLLLLVGFFSWFQHFFYSQGYQRGPMNIVTMFEFTSIIFGLVADKVMFQRDYNFMTYCGVILIVVSLIMVSQSKKPK